MGQHQPALATKLKGGIIPPLLHAERNIHSACRRKTIFHSACRRKTTTTDQKTMKGGRRITWCRGGRCLAGRIASLVILWWRPVAVSWLTDDDSPAAVTVSNGNATVFQCFPLSSRFVFNFPTPFQAFPSFPIFRFLSLSVRSLSLVCSAFSCVFVSFFSLRFFFFSLSVCPPSSRKLVLRAVFIESRGAGESLSPAYRCVWGATPTCPVAMPGEASNGHGWQGVAPLVFHHERA